jgi:uncharacterized repeat protein (TIGR01451 family)
LTTHRALKWLVTLTVLANLLGASLAWAQNDIADIAVSKSGPAEAAAGSNVTYTVTVFNNGPNAVSPRLLPTDSNTGSITLTDNIPSGMTFVSAAPLSGCSTPSVGSGGTITCTINSLAAMTSVDFTFVFNIPSVTAPGTVFTNVATATLPDRPFNESEGVVNPDPDDENNSGSATTTVSGGASQADLGVTKTGPSAAAPNTDVVYTIVVNNAGPAAASSVTLTDTLQGGMTFVSISPSSGCTTPPPGSTITCNIAALGAGASVTYTLTAHVPFAANGTVIPNTATVSAATTDPNSENNSSTTSLTVSDVDVSVTKTTGSSTVNAGDTISYTLTVSNGGSGESQAINVQLSDTLPPNTTFVSLTQNSGPAPDSPCSTPAVGGTGTVTCFWTSLASGASATFTLVIQVGDTTSVTNTATVSTDSPDSNSSNNTASVTTPVNASADVGVTNSGPATGTAGSNLTYTVTVTNAGPSTATDATRGSRALAPAATVTLTDVLPPGTTFVSLTQTSGPAFSCATPAVGAGGTITCTIAALAPGASATFVITVRLGSGTASGTTVTNTATVTSATPDPNPANNQSTSSSTSSVSADVSVSKTGPATVAAGSNVTYTVVVANAGPSDAASASLSDPLPPGTTFVSLTQTAGPTFGCTTPAAGGTGTITCAIAALPAGTSSTFSLVVKVSAGTTGAITNTATVTASTTDPNPGNNSSTTNATVATGADVGVVKTGPAAASPGTNATYTVTVSNAGPADALSVVLSDAVPAGTTFVSATPTSGAAAACTGPAVGGTGTITCTIPTLPAGASSTFSIVVNVSAGTTGAITNTATVTAATTDPNSANNSSTTTASVSGADVSVTKTGPPFVATTANVTYSVTVANAGPAAAASVSLSDPLPTGTTFVSLTQGTGPAFACTTPAAGANGTITCTIASLPSGASATFSIVVNVSAGASGTITNTATVTTTTPDPVASNNSSTTATIAPGAADLSVTKTAGTPNPTGNITFSIVVTNLGPAIGQGVVVTDVLPGGTTFVSVASTQGSCTTGSTVTCAIGTLPVGGSATITLVVTILSNAVVANTATVSAASVDPNLANNSSTALAGSATIPTLSPATFALLAFLLTAAGFWVLRRRRPASPR